MIEDRLKEIEDSKDKSALKNQIILGDLVIDPFAGSGTVCRIAKELGRDFLGFEISPEYHKYAVSTL